MIHLKLIEQNNHRLVNLEKESNIDMQQLKQMICQNLRKDWKKLFYEEAGLLTDEEFTAQKKQIVE